MMKIDFAKCSAKEVVRLLEQHPLAWIWAVDPDGPFATAAPLCAQSLSDEIVRLVGHLPRSSRLAQLLRTPAGGLVLVTGPEAYVSPSWFRNRCQAPTWNYASAQLVVDLRVIDDDMALRAHFDELVTLMERGRELAWNVDEMGERYAKLAARVIAFEAKVRSWSGRFKLGQDESDETWGEIVAALNAAGNTALVEWMRAFNLDR